MEKELHDLIKYLIINKKYSKANEAKDIGKVIFKMAEDPEEPVQNILDEEFGETLLDEDSETVSGTDDSAAPPTTPTPTTTPTTPPPLVKLSDELVNLLISSLDARITTTIPSIKYKNTQGNLTRLTYKSNSSLDVNTKMKIAAALKSLVASNSNLSSQLETEASRLLSEVNYQVPAGDKMLNQTELDTIAKQPGKCGVPHDILYVYVNDQQGLYPGPNYKVDYRFSTAEKLYPIFTKIKEQNIPGNDSTKLERDIAILKLLMDKNGRGIKNEDAVSLAQNSQGTEIQLATLVTDPPEDNPCNYMVLKYHIKEDIEGEDAKNILRILKSIKDEQYPENQAVSTQLDAEITRLEGKAGVSSGGTNRSNTGGSRPPPADREEPKPDGSQNIADVAAETFTRFKEIFEANGITLQNIMDMLGGGSGSSGSRPPPDDEPDDESEDRETRSNVSGREVEEDEEEPREPREPRRPPPPTEAELAAQRRRALEERRRRRRGTQARQPTQIVPLVSTVSREGRNIGIFEDKSLPASAPIEERYVEIANDGSGWKKTDLSNPERRELIKSMRGTITKPKNHLDFLRELERSRISGAKGNTSREERLRERATSHQGRRNWR